MILRKINRLSIFFILIIFIFIFLINADELKIDDEKKISSSKNNVDEEKISSSKNNVDEAKISSSKNNVDEEKAKNCINESRLILIEFIAQNLSIQRVNDSLRQAENLYEAQIALKGKNASFDFSLVLPYCSDINEIKKSAYEARDSFSAFKKFYRESFNNSDINTTSVDIIVNEIKNEMKNERYEKVSHLIDNAYKEITKLQAEFTTLNIFYKSTTRGIKVFFEKNWKFLAIVFLVIIILLFIYYKAISKWLVKRKIRLLELRKKTLKEIIQQTQKDYFQYGKISEGTFSIKTKKLAELIRDIDRQIPLLQENLAKLDKKTKPNKK